MRVSLRRAVGATIVAGAAGLGMTAAAQDMFPNSPPKAPRPMDAGVAPYVQVDPYGSTQLPGGVPGGPAGQAGEIPPPRIPGAEPTPAPPMPMIEPAPLGPSTTPGLDTTAPVSPDLAAPTTPEFDFAAGGGAAPDFTPAAAAGTGGGAGVAASGFAVIGDSPMLQGIRAMRTMSQQAAQQARMQQLRGIGVAGQQVVGPPTVVSPITPAVPSPLLNTAVRGIKIAENQSPIPQDRLFFSFNFYDNIGQVYNQRDMTGITNLRVYQYLFGYEQTFFDGDASIGFRLPLNSLNVDSVVQGLGGQQTALGDLSIFVKSVFYEASWSDNQALLLTAGLNVTPPTGPRSFAGYGGPPGFPGFLAFKSTTIQPFLGYFYSRGRFFLQGFSAVGVPVGVGDSDVTVLFNDINMGYMVYEDRQSGRLITAIAPVFETHVNTPLNHRGYFMNDPASSFDQVNLTFGLNVELANTGVATFGYATPVTGPNLFDYEFIFQLNIYFGRRGPAGLGLDIIPPVL